MKKLLSLLALTLTSAAFAGPTNGTVQGYGNSTTQNFNINATVGDACVLSNPANVTFNAPMYWTQNEPVVTKSTSVNVQCNTGAYFSLQFAGPVTLTSGSNPVILTAFLSPDGAPTGNPYIAGGATFPIKVDVNRPTQGNASGLYSGVATVTLSMILD